MKIFYYFIYLFNNFQLCEMQKLGELQFGEMQPPLPFNFSLNLKIDELKSFIGMIEYYYKIY